MKRYVPPAPTTAARCDADWIGIRRDIIARGRFLLRPGGGNTIEIRTLTPPEQLAAHDHLKVNPWVPLKLPDEAISFTTAADRDAVLQQLQQPAQPV